MMASLEQLVCRYTGATSATQVATVQSLWSGYGEIVRMYLAGLPISNAIVKRVVPPPLKSKNQVRATAAAQSHARKLKSYAVEAVWYRKYSNRCDDSCRVPQLLGLHEDSEGWLFVLEDLDAAGFGARPAQASSDHVKSVLGWLAAFHATFLHVAPVGLWKVGTYWHLATRAHELGQMQNQVLRALAPKIDARLNGCQFRTLVHGDAKLENFYFSPDPDKAGTPKSRVSAVDFQYVGAGCGIKDVVYFMSSVWSAAECKAGEADALAFYFSRLRTELELRQLGCEAVAVEQEWRALYPYAWADFQRFLEGWARGQYDGDPYAAEQVERIRANEGN